jgi:predicted site-specific integrase-resolvase
MAEPFEATYNADSCEFALVEALKETGSEIVNMQKNIIHSYCIKIYFAGYKKGFCEGFDKGEKT